MLSFEFMLGVAATLIIGGIVYEGARFLWNRRRPFIYALIEPANYASGDLGYRYIVYNANGGPILSSNVYPTWSEANRARAEFLRSKRVAATTVLREKDLRWDVEYRGAVAEHNDRVTWRGAPA